MEHLEKQGQMGVTPICTDNKRNVIFYGLGSEFTSHVKSIENDTLCTIELYTAWSDLVARLTTSACPFPSVIVMGMDTFGKCDLTVHEIIDTLSALCRYDKRTSKVRLAVGLRIPDMPSKCDIDFIKEIQQADIMGIVPSPLQFSYEAAIHALRELLQSRKYWPKSIIELVNASGKANNQAPTGIHLTSRQRQVHTLLCNRGISNKKIASILKISESTVKVHISAILRAYGVRNRTQLVLATANSLSA